MKKEGVIKHYNHERGFGFITCDNADTFFHISGVKNLVDGQTPKKQQRCVFEIVAAKKGAQAVEVLLVD